MDRFRTLPNYRYYNDNTGVIETQYAKPLRDYTISGNASGVGDKTKNLLPKLPVLSGYKSGFENAVYLPVGEYTISVEEFKGCEGFRYEFYVYHSDGTRMTLAELGNGTNSCSFIKGSYITDPKSSYGVSTRGMYIAANGTILMQNSAIDMENPVLKLTFDKADIITTDIDGNEVTRTYDGYWVEFFISHTGFCNEDGSMGSNVTTGLSFINPQLETGTEATEYEPYGYKIPIELSGENTEQQTYKIFLNKPLGVGESISYMNDKENLPKIKLNKETNVITVKTENKPDEVNWQYYK